MNQDISSHTMGALSLKKGGYLCLIKYYSEKNRWFIDSIIKIENDKKIDTDLIFSKKINKLELKNLIVDIPLSHPPCHECQMTCPGINNCPIENVTIIREDINKLIKSDKDNYNKNPKSYEHNRKGLQGYILSKSFKNKIKKGFTPYLNRPLDYWIWINYYDIYLKFFKNSYNSFGNIPQLMTYRLDYIKRHISSGINIYESDQNLILIELLKANIINEKFLKHLSHIELSIEARILVIRMIEKHLNLFIYDNDIQTLVGNPMAFNALLLSLASLGLYFKNIKKLPHWTEPSKTNFIIPTF